MLEDRERRTIQEEEGGEWSETWHWQALKVTGSSSQDMPVAIGIGSNKVKRERAAKLARLREPVVAIYMRPLLQPDRQLPQV